MRCAVERDRYGNRRRCGDAYLSSSGEGAWGDREKSARPQRTESLVVHNCTTVTMLPFDVAAGDGRSESTMNGLDTDQEYQAGGGDGGTDPGLREGEARHLL
jgi:hypothetical protein